MSQNVIELNGKRYDAITGAFLGKGGVTTPVAAPHHHPVPSSGRVIDGFIRQPKPKPAAHHVPAAAKATAVVRYVAPKASTDVADHTAVHTAAKHLQRHQPQHATTLMRSVVHKPEIHLKPAIKPQSPAEVMARPASALAPKRSASQIDPSRLERAKSAMKHAAVRRFHSAKSGVEPVGRSVQPVTERVPIIAVRPQPTQQSHHVVPAPQADIFEAAIKRAKSHEQPRHKRQQHQRRTVNILATVAAFFILGGFITYLNLPNIQLHIVSIEAGFHASMPNYKPAGYALQGGVHRRGGTVSMRFASGDSSFQITQQSSNWDSQALLDNTLALSGHHQTIQRNGRIVYVYGDGANAAWVTGSVRYDITGNASLSADQLADIAASM